MFYSYFIHTKVNKWKQENGCKIRTKYITNKLENRGLGKHTLRAMKHTNNSTSEWKATSLALRLLFYLFFFTNKFFNHIWVAVCRVSEVAPSISPLTFFLILYQYLFETLTYTTFHFTRWSRDCLSVEWEPISLGFHMSAPKEAIKVGSETTDEYT